MNEATRKYIYEHRSDNVKHLAFSAHPAEVDLSYALTQITGRQSIKNKIPSWYENDHIIYPQHLSLEQCSSESTAKYKASLVKGTSFIDLTGGFGVDCAFLSSRFQSAIYVERQQSLCEIASENFKSIGLKNIQVICNESIHFLQNTPPVNCIYIDPARRYESGSKIIAIQDCEPDVIALKDLLLEKAETVMVKLSPMLDVSIALQALPETTELHIISTTGECKELLFILKKGLTENPMITCVNLLKSGEIQLFSFYKQEEQNCTADFTPQPEKFIYEPNASVLKSGAYKLTACRFNLKKLHPDSHLYTSSELIQHFPGRTFELISIFSFNKKDIKENLKEIKQANISIRNFPGSVDELRKKLKLKEGGDIYLFATTLSDGKKVLLKTKKSQSPWN